MLGFDGDLQSLFRDDGTPLYVRFDRTSRSAKPPGIRIDINRGSKARFQRHISVPLQDVEETWEMVGDIWLEAVGIEKGHFQRNEAYALFKESLRAFLIRYEVDTERKCIFTER